MAIQFITITNNDSKKDYFINKGISFKKEEEKEPIYHRNLGLFSLTKDYKEHKAGTYFSLYSIYPESRGGSYAQIVHTIKDYDFSRMPSHINQEEIDDMERPILANGFSLEDKENIMDNTSISPNFALKEHKEKFIFAALSKHHSELIVALTKTDIT